jgi:type IV pilus assembly protein PilV
MKRIPHLRRHEQGAALLEVLVTMLLIAFGLLGLAGLIGRAFVTEFEATQRAQALLLLQDMSTRIEANRKLAANYVTNSSGVSTSGCAAPATLAAVDKCQWASLLAGTNEKLSGADAPILPGAAGCIYEIDAVRKIYAIAIAWQATNPTSAPANGSPEMGCGLNAFGPETYRRIVTTQVQIADLGVPAP